ncbi:MAG TPA: hypothetical protein VGV93_13075 [Acidimicrobiales bacterium]|nr:hypothetical protein [Acidimicrobiales bacterium]
MPDLVKPNRRPRAISPLGTLQYDTYFNDDETECIVIERFRDPDALIDHGENALDGDVATGRLLAYGGTTKPETR